jgi:hypothetical protein
LYWNEAAKESIYDGACMKQVFQGAKRCGLIRTDSTVRLLGGRNVRPVSRDERFTSVGQDQQEMQSTMPMDGLKNSERFTFEWMTRPDNRDSLRKVLMMGSVS